MGDYVILTGDTLSKIALSELGDIGLWRALAEANKIENPNRIYAGDTIVIDPAAIAAAKIKPGARNLKFDDTEEAYSELLQKNISDAILLTEQLRTYTPVSKKKPASGGSAPTLPAKTTPVNGTKSGTPSTSKTIPTTLDLTDGINVLTTTYGIDKEAAKKLLRKVLIDKDNPKLYRGNFVGNSEIKVGDFIEYGHSVNTFRDILNEGSLLNDLIDYANGWNKSAIVVDVNGTGRNRELTVAYFNPKTFRIEIGYIPATTGGIKRAYRNKPEKIKEWAK